MVWLSGEVTSIYKGMDKGYIIYFIYDYIYIHPCTEYFHL